jgi:F-type H+-transporting ATPase subunit b
MPSRSPPGNVPRVSALPVPLGRAVRGSDDGSEGRFMTTSARLLPALALVAITPLPLRAADGGGGGLFSVDPGLFVWTIVVFLVVLVVLRKWAWGPILGALGAREAGIRGSIDDARSLREEAEKALEENRKQLADARRQSQEIVAEGRAAAERISREIEAKAREEGDRLLERARVEIGRERDAALREIRAEAVELALAAASRLLQERLTDDRDRALIERYLEEIQPPSAEA